MKVEVYGGNHSPWVQAVLLALHEQGIEHSLRQVPPFEALKQWGVLMPAVSIDGGPWQVESSQILVKLGLKPVCEDDLKAVQAAWQGVLHRVDNPALFAAFARAGDKSTSLLKRSARNFFRSFIPLYMFLLINFVKLKIKPVEPKILQSSIYSNAPSPPRPARSWMATAQAQEISCCSVSCSVTPAFQHRRLRHCNATAPNKMRQWVASMHERFSHYPHLYSGSKFEPYYPRPAAADPLRWRLLSWRAYHVCSVSRHGTTGICADA